MNNTKAISKDNGKFRQFMATVIVNLTVLANGMLSGWPSPTIPMLQSDASPVGESPISEVGVSWITSLPCLTALMVAPFMGLLIEKLGRKGFGYVSAIPFIVSWLLILFAPSHAYLYAARFIGGLGVGMSVCLSPIYVSEIANEEIRGALGSLLLFAINVGILLAFATGPFMSYTAFGIFSLVFPLLFLGTFVFVPETPVYLVRQNRLIEANKSLMYFKGDNKALAEQELSRLLAEIKSTKNPAKKPGLLDLFKDRATFKGIIIVLGLFGGQQLGGISIMINYAQTIFKMAGSSLSPESAAIIIGAIQVLGSYLSTVLIERAGRRLLILISCGGMAVCHIVVGSFCYLQKANYNVSSIAWIPVAAVSIYMVAYCLGMGPAPFVIASEVFRIDISSLANTFCFTYVWGMAFLAIKLFGPLADLIGIDGCFFLLGGFCLGSFIFAYILVPETKGRTREDIVQELMGLGKTDPRADDNLYVNVKAKDLNDKDLVAAVHV